MSSIFSLMPLGSVILFLGCSSITLTYVTANDKSPGHTNLTLKNCHCTCYDEDVVSQNQCNVSGQRNMNSSYRDAGVEFVGREEWGARAPTKTLLDLVTVPAPYVVISHTSSKNCLSKAQCMPQIRSIQTFHIESHAWLDIGYNFLVGGDGIVYVGRGWDKQGAYTHKYHKDSIEISFIGTFRDESPSEVQLATAKKLLQIGLRENKLAPDYKLLEHKQVGVPKTERPGDHLYDIIKTWDHWDPNL